MLFDKSNDAPNKAILEVSGIARVLNLSTRNAFESVGNLGSTGLGWASLCSTYILRKTPYCLKTEGFSRDQVHNSSSDFTRTKPILENKRDLRHVDGFKIKG